MHMRRHFIAGLFVLIPIVITLWVLHLVFTWLSELGQPLVTSLIQWVSVTPGSVVDRERVERIQRTLELFKDILSFIFVVVLIYLLGWLTTKVVGRRVLDAFDNVVDRIPLAKGIYGTLKQLLGTLQTKPEGVQRVVLIAFPNPGMKSVGLVTRTFIDPTTDREVAAVYVPIAPFLTSGNLEIVPIEELVNTDWSVDEAMRFIASGGSVLPTGVLGDRAAAIAAPDAAAASI